MNQLPVALVKNLIFFAKGGITILILLMLLGLWRTGGRLFQEIQGFFDPNASQPEINVRTPTLQQVRNASELTTAIFAMEAVVPAQQDRKLGNITVGQTKLLYIAYGEVRAGVDLSQLEPQDVKTTDNRITIQLPPPQILDSKIDVNRSEVYDYDRGFLDLGPDVAPQLQTLAQRQTLSEIVTTACQQGILTQANERAELIVTNLFANAGYDSVTAIPTSPNLQSCVDSQV
ncbi:MAG: DUF4230 domain-containing protein [Jaaginema sp. PMC 1079.18]|nr:DUF4230 domain-containing protein [Jaaginema sp. PMC 1080.18]MEC4850052.1 DUF4230 domain-containing protein [Jaaginema sp. PMC 1079.18]MEC4865152.1 DUF4230 domain-containing protein [Jaaginema sp. PMC 1078.18]